MGLDGYRKYCQMRCEALNYTLRNIPEEQIRYHSCWGSWHGPHSADLPLPDIVDILLSVKAQIYSIEAANVRHEHEVAVWQDVKLPDGKMLAPGVVTHSTPLISIHSSSPVASSGSPNWSGARTSSPQPTAALAFGSIHRWRGPS